MVLLTQMQETHNRQYIRKHKPIHTGPLMSGRQEVSISGSEPARLTALIKRVWRLWRGKAQGHCVLLCVRVGCGFLLSVFVCVGSTI